MTDIFTNTEITSTFEQLDKYLSKVIAIPRLKQDVKESEVSKAFLQYSLDFYAWVSEQVKSIVGDADIYDQKLSKLVERINIEIDSSIKANKEREFTIESYNDLKDHVQYIYVWLLNNYDINIDEIEESEIQNIQNNVGSLDEVDKTQKAGFLNDNFFEIQDPHKYSENPNQFIEQCINKTQAINRLALDIKKGTIYIYTARPKRNVWLKWLLLLLNYCAIFISVLFLMVGGMLLVTADSAMTLDDKNKIGKLFLISIASLVYFGYSIKDGFDAFKNDNYKYVFSKKTCWYSILYSVFFILLNVFDPKFRNLFHGASGTDSNHPFLIINSILIFLIMATTTINVCAHIWLNPPRNDKLIQSMLGKYSSDKNKPCGFDQTKQ